MDTVVRAPGLSFDLEPGGAGREPLSTAKPIGPSSMARPNGTGGRPATRGRNEPAVGQKLRLRDRGKADESILAPQEQGK
jgi:hypothetical protein